MMKKEPGIEDEEAKMMMTTTNWNGGNFHHEGTQAVAFTNKETYVNAFMPDAQAIIQRMETSEEVEEVKYADTPGFATAEQIRASFMRRGSNVSPLKRKRDASIIEIKEEPVSTSSTNEHEHENQVMTTTPKRNRLSMKNPLTPHTARQIAQNTNTAPAKLAGRKMLIGEDDMTRKLREATELVNHLDIIIGNAQKKLKDDVKGADTLLTAAKDLIGASMGGRSSREEVGLALRESTGHAFRESTGHTSRESTVHTIGKSTGQASREPAPYYRDSSEDGI